MTKMVLTRGLPASGKSTWARELVNSDPTFVRLNRDDFRQMLYGKAVLDANGEIAVTIAQHGAVDNALKSGMNVVVDDTNFFARGVKSLLKIAAKYDAEVQFVNFTDVPLEVCIRRDAIRREQGNSNLSGAVGEQVIRGMHDRYIKGRSLPLAIPDFPVLEVEPYVADESLPSAVIVDIDGTIAKMLKRSPYDWMRVGEDTVVESVASAVRDAARSHQILFTSGRNEVCRQITDDWLRKNIRIPASYYDLFMRSQNDNRRDDIVKYELFNNNIRNNYNVKYVLDDRDQVVRMWRKLGLTCMQVAPGDF